MTEADRKRVEEIRHKHDHVHLSSYCIDCSICCLLQFITEQQGKIERLEGQRQQYEADMNATYDEFAKAESVKNQLTAANVKVRRLIMGR